MATSPTGSRGRSRTEDLIESRVEEDEAQASPDVLLRRRAATTCSSAIGAAANFRGKESATGSATRRSTDLADWQRDDDHAGIDVSDGDGWDSEMISYPHVFEVDGRDLHGVSRQRGRPVRLRPGRP